MANTAGRKAGDPKAVAGKVKAGEILDTAKVFSSPNWRPETKNAMSYKKESTITTSWKKP